MNELSSGAEDAHPPALPPAVVLEVFQETGDMSWLAHWIAHYDGNPADDLERECGRALVIDKDAIAGI